MTIRGDVDFEDALDDPLNYQAIKRDPQRIAKLKPYINKYNWKGIEFPAGPKECKNLSKIIKKLHLIYYMLKKTKKISAVY